MNIIKFLIGWVGWHLRAGFWYLGLVFRLWFAIGLDRDCHPGQEEDIQRHFRCPYPRKYLKYLNTNANQPS